MLTANPYISSLVPYKPGKPIEETAREIGMQPEDIVKLASNENPLGPSPLAVRAMQNTSWESNLYPDGSAFTCRQRIASFHDVAMEQVVTVAGSSELLLLLSLVFLGPGTHAIAADHSFALYKILSQTVNGGYVSIPNKPDFSSDLQATLRAITPETRLVYIANPTNPLGTMVHQQELDDFMAAVPDHVVVVFDEAYIQYADDQPDTLKYLEQGKNVVVSRTFSKVYGLAGLRVGYAVTTPRIAAYLNRTRSPFNVSSIAQAAATAALNDTHHLQRTVALNRAGRQFFEQQFQARGIPYIPSNTNFILVKIGNGLDCFNKCLAQGVILRPMAAYGLPEYIRITIGTQEQNERCIKALFEE